MLGFLGNAWDEAKDMASGLGTLAATVVGDAGRAVATGATLGQVDFNFKTDDLVNAVTGGVLNTFGEEGWHPSESVIYKDFAQRYGALLPGGRPASEVFEEMYKNPLSFVGDALTIATAGGYGAAKAASLAGKFGKVGEVAAATGKAASVLDELALAEKGAIAAEDVGRAAQFVKAVQGSATKYINPVTKKVEFFNPLKNPVKRKLFQEPALKLLMERGEKGALTAETLAQQALTEGPESLAQFQKALNIQTMANKAISGEVPVLKTWAARKLTNKAVDLMVGGVKANARTPAEDLLRELNSDDVFGKLPEDIAPEDLVDHLNGMDGTHTNDGYTPRVGRGPRDGEAFDEIGPSTREEPVGWGIEPGADEATTGASMVARAQEVIGEVVPILRRKYGPGVVSGRVKGVDDIARKASARGTVRAVDDTAGVRVTLDDAWTGDVRKTMDDIAGELGGEVRSHTNDIGVPDETGARQFSFIVDRGDGAPIEVQLMTPLAEKTWDASKNLRAHIAGLERRILDHPDAPDVNDLKLELQAARAESQHLWGGVTADLRAKLGGHVDTELRQRANRARLAIWKNQAEPALEAGLPVRSMFENKYLGQKFLNGASFNAEEGVWDGMSAFELEAQSAKQGLMQPLYVPQLDMRRLPKKGDFLLSNVPASLRRVSDKNMERNTGYLMSEGLEAGKNAGDWKRIYSIRAKRAARTLESHELVKATIREYGRRVTNQFEVGDDEVLWSPDILNAMHRTETGVDDAVADALANGLDPELSAAEALKAINVSQQKKVLKGAADQDVELYAIPKVVAKRLDAHAKTLGMNSTLDAAWGAPTALWKNMVLAGSPRWILNNVVGNTVFLKMQGGKLSDVVRQLSPAFRAKVKEAMGEKGLRASESGFFDELVKDTVKYDDDVFAGAVAQRIQQSSAVNAAAKPFRKWSEMAHKINGAVEDAYRRASYMTAAERASLLDEGLVIGKRFWTSKSSIDRIYRYGLDPKRAGKAIDEMNAFLNDYGAMTPAGRSIIRPYIAPFWGFYRHAAKMMLTMPFEHPGKARLLQYMNDAQEQEGDKLGSLPSWLQSQLPLGAGASAGDYRFMSTAGLNPFNAVFENPTNSFHPFWKMAFEQASGRSSFSGKQFTDPNVISAYGSDQQYRIDPNTGETIPVDKVAPGFLEHLMMQVPQYDLAKDLIAGGSTYDTSGLVDAARGEALIEDPETGEPLYPKDRLLQLARLFGYTESTYNIKDFTDKRLEETEQVLKVWLERNPEAAKELGLS